MHRDRLSELPLSLIHHILSFLPIGDVVSTTLLSKHWVNLWTTVPCINIQQHENINWGTKSIVKQNENFREFVNGALRRWKGTKIQKFIIHMFNRLLYDDAHEWTLFALENKVEELEIYASHHTSPVCCVLQDLYSSSSLLSECNVGFRGPLSWNQLKSLTLELDQTEGGFYCNIFDLVIQIMLGSPVLEVFEMVLYRDDNYVNLNITSTSLKRLKIFISVWTFEGESESESESTSLNTLSICCPNLETLEISGLFKCVFTDISSLTDATIDFHNPDGVRDRGSWFELLGESLMQIFIDIQNVEKLALTGMCVQVFGALPKKYLLSPLPNVKFLKLDVHQRHPIEFGNMVDLLGIFPNLKKVIFERLAFRKPPVSNTVNNMESETNISKSYLLQMKIIEITSHSCDSSFVGFIEFLLKHGVMLEKLVIGLKRSNLSEQKMLSEKVLSMPRSSSIAEVILKFN